MLQPSTDLFYFYNILIKFCVIVSLKHNIVENHENTIRVFITPIEKDSFTEFSLKIKIHFFCNPLESK